MKPVNYLIMLLQMNSSVVLAATVETLCPLLVINSFFVNFDIVFNLFLIN